MKKILGIFLVVVVLVGLSASYVVWSKGHKMLVAHVTSHVDDDETGECMAVVIAVPESAVEAHMNHGDSMAPEGASPGDRLTGACR